LLSKFKKEDKKESLDKFKKINKKEKLDNDEEYDESERYAKARNLILQTFLINPVKMYRKPAKYN